MRISEVAIKKPVFAWMLMLGLLVFGGIGFQRMGVSQLPDVDFPYVNIGLTLEGAAPEIMEVDVVDPVEDAVMSIQGIKSVSSSSKTGSASVSVEFELEKNIDTAVQEIQTALGQVQRKLPKDIDPPVVSKSNPEDQPILWLAVFSDRLADTELMSLVRDQIKDRFTTVPGVAEVFLGGYVDPNLRVWLSGTKLRDYQLTAQDIIQTIQSEHAELPAGRLETPARELNIRTIGEAPTVKDFASLPISRRGGSPNFIPISLGQISKIEENLADVRRKSRSMGKQAVGLGIRKQRGTNAVQVAHAVKERMIEVKKFLPAGTDIAVRFDSTQFIEESIGELNFTLILSALLTAVVCWLFLGSWSATLNVILAIPTSVVGSFIILYFLGFTLNTFTLLGLSLAIGIVVDDAIMVLENIVRHREKGETRYNAALNGTLEISFAAAAATAAIIAIFLPVAFMKGIVGKFFFQFGVTISVAVALSLLEALTLTPMRCSQYLEMGERTSRIGRWIESSFHSSSVLYEKYLKIVLNHRWKTVLGSLIFFVASFALLGFLKKEFSPAQDQGRLMIRVQTPVGSSLDFTDTKIKLAEEIISRCKDLEGYFSAVGGFGGGEVNTGMLFVTFKELKNREKNPKNGKPLTAQEIAVILRKELSQIPDLKVSIQDPSTSGFGSRRGYPVEFSIKGSNWDILSQSTTQMIEAMTKSGLMTDIDTDYRTGMPEILVMPDREKARARGVSVYDIGQVINMMMGGVVAGKYSKNGHRYDVRVRLLPEFRTRADDIRVLQVRNNRGELIPLSEVVQIKETTSLQAISRLNRERTISVFANVAPHSSQAKAIEEVKKISEKILPPGYSASPSGSAESFKESFQSLLFALLLGLIVSYMVLASQFNSFIHPFTVLMALPFSISGAFIALAIGNQSLNLYSMIGLILLMGIVKKNSILLVDFTNQTREETASMTAREALVKACPVRLRPILMTSIATIAGAIPPALAIGPGAESRIPMALAVIGGVTVSTFLTLFVVPCVYSLLDRISHSKHGPVS